jgi:ribosomal-protein-alanine N-acetyltransferase
MFEPITTEKLRLRDWKDSEYLPFFKMNSNPEVMDYFPALLSQEESNELACEIQRRINENGWGLWAVEEKESEKFVGFVGLNQPTTDLPFNPYIEVGWRLAKEFWERGYATEAGKRALEYAFDILLFKEVVVFTSVTNHRSQAVMQRLGMNNSHRNFNHPDVPAHHPLYEHFLYKISRERWQLLNT